MWWSGMMMMTTCDVIVQKAIFASAAAAQDPSPMPGSVGPGNDYDEEDGKLLIEREWRSLLRGAFQKEQQDHRRATEVVLNGRYLLYNVLYNHVECNIQSSLFLCNPCFDMHGEWYILICMYWCRRSIRYLCTKFSSSLGASDSRCLLTIFF